MTAAESEGREGGGGKERKRRRAMRDNENAASLNLANVGWDDRIGGNMPGVERKPKPDQSNR
jgi:hypothetical protein